MPMLGATHFGRPENLHKIAGLGLGEIIEVLPEIHFMEEPCCSRPVGVPSAPDAFPIALAANHQAFERGVIQIEGTTRAQSLDRLPGSTMYVTIEPCQMCVGAMVHARVARVVYGTPEPKAGAIESAMRAHEHPSLNHRLEVTGRVLEDDCREVIQSFFKERRSSD